MEALEDDKTLYEIQQESIVKEGDVWNNMIWRNESCFLAVRFCVSPQNQTEFFLITHIFLSIQDI